MNDTGPQLEKHRACPNEILNIKYYQDTYC